AKSQSALLPALRLVQDQHNGWLNKELLNAVADYICVPRIKAYEVASFYSMYELEPIGKHKICVCTNIACMLRGSKNIINHLEKKLKVKIGETTEDGRYTLKEVECLAACGGAPMMQIDDREYYENLTPDQVDVILADIEKKDMR
ncbi:MAG TPA: NAD(P)H-dependent oxidoreductase subunit E, partial [Gammaproteobacteria bacterium]|nr:NAD(P)H-dependent oxidoreductase subunit E [Gammaproteobacteria bacterium]